MATPREVLHILPVLRKFRAKELEVRLGCVLRWGQMLLTPDAVGQGRRWRNEMRRVCESQLPYLKVHDDDREY
jgi:hypothetical protein